MSKPFLNLAKTAAINSTQIYTGLLPLSVCIVTNNWHPKLNDIIQMLSDKVAEINIGYDGNMNEILQQCSFNVYITPIIWEGYSNTKNKLAVSANHNWILSLDSDEVPDEALIKHICALDFNTLQSQTQFSFKRYSFFEGKLMKHGSWGNDKVRRLYNKTATKWDDAIVHESLEQNVHTIHRTLSGSLMHFTADDYQTFLNKSQRYARLSADKYFQQGKKATLLKRYFSPLFSFIKEYFFQLGFLDGIRGWKIAKGNAVYTFWKYKFLEEKYAESQK